MSQCTWHSQSLQTHFLSLSTVLECVRFFQFPFFREFLELSRNSPHGSWSSFLVLSLYPLGFLLLFCFSQSGNCTFPLRSSSLCWPSSFSKESIFTYKFYTSPERLQAAYFYSAVYFPLVGYCKSRGLHGTRSLEDSSSYYIFCAYF